MAELASTQYLSVHSLPQEDCYDTDDASAREIYSILVPESTMYTVQSSWRRPHHASVVDRDAPAHRRLRCTACGRELSEREGTLLARSKLPEETVVRLLKCQRWGVCDEGTTDICDVALKRVHRFQRVAAQRAETHHRQVVQEVEVQGVQLDEAHSKLRPKQVEWVHTALAMGSWFLLWVDFGPRTQEQAAMLIAQVVVRVRTLPVFLTDGWRAYTAALLQVVGVLYRPRRRGKVGRKPKPRLVASKALYYAQVVKVRNQAGQVVEVSRQVVFGGPPSLYQTVAPAGVWGDYPDRLYGTVVWDAAGPGGPIAAPYPLSVLAAHPPRRTGLAAGESL